MQMKKNRVYLAFVAVVGMLGVSASAWALSYTSYFTIDQLEVSGGSTKIWPVGSTISVGTCSTDYYEIMNGTSAEQAVEFNKAIMAAFLAGKKIKLAVTDNSCGANNRPQYTRLLVDKDE
jgi:hypothetical protein